MIATLFLAFFGAAADVTLVPVAATLALTGAPASLAAGASLAPASATLALTGAPGTIAASASLSPGTGLLAITGSRPVITAGGATPTAGATRPPAGRFVVARASPKGMTSVAYQPDPSDVLDFGFGIDALLQRDDIDTGTLTLTLDPGAAALGVAVLTDGAHAPATGEDGDGVFIAFWLGVAAEHQADAAFDGGGIEARVTISFATTHAPPRRYERTLAVTVRNA